MSDLTACPSCGWESIQDQCPHCHTAITRAPCPTCPWRKSSTVGGGDIPDFDIRLMRSLSNTVGEGDAIRPIMACHGSACGRERICIGYAAVEGWSNIAVRLMAARGAVDMRAIETACDGIELWPSFAKMLAAYEEAAAEP